MGEVELAYLSNYSMAEQSSFRIPGETMSFDFSKQGTVAFSEDCLDAIGDPEYVLPLISTKTKTFILAGWIRIGPRDGRPKGYRVRKDENGAFVLNNCRQFLTEVAAMMGWRPCEGTKMVFLGESRQYCQDKRMISFDLHEALMFTTSSPDELAGYIADNAMVMQRKGYEL